MDAAAVTLGAIMLKLIGLNLSEIMDNAAAEPKIRCSNAGVFDTSSQVTSARAGLPDKSICPPARRIGSD